MKVNRLTDYFLTHRTLFWSLVVMLVAGGLFCYHLMPKLEDPFTANRMAAVVVPYPGASAGLVEERVAKPLEEQIYTLPDIRNVFTTCHSDMAMIQVEFNYELSAEEVENHYGLLRRKVSDFEPSLPSGTYDPIIIDDMSDIYGIMYALTGDGYKNEELYGYACTIRDELLQVKGVKRVNIVGKRPQQINIRVNRDRVAGNGLLPTEIMLALQSVGIPHMSGRYDVGDESLPYDIQEETSIDDIKNIPVRLLPSGNARLCDLVDDVTLDYAEPQQNGYFVDGEPALAICVTMENSAVVPDVGDLVEERVGKCMETMPIGIDIQKVFFQPDLVNKALDGFMINLIESVLIVVIVLTLFMGWRSGVIISLGLILTILGSFIGLFAWGTTMQRMSLGAFIIAMGMLVDNAVVVMDGILVDRRKGLDRQTFLTRIVGQTAMPLLGATLIAIVSFIGVYLSTGATAEYASDIFRVIAFSLFVSWILAVTQIPVCADKWLPKSVENEKESRLSLIMQRWMRKTLNVVMNHRLTSLVVAVVLLILSIVGFRFVKMMFFPDFEYSQCVVECFWPEPTNAGQVKQYLLDMTDELLKDKEIKRVCASQGSAPARYCMVRPMTSGGNCYGELMVDFEDYETMIRKMGEIREKLRAQYPDAYIRMRKYNLSIATSHTIEVEFNGPDTKVLHQLAEQAKEIMRGSDQIDHYSIQDDWLPMGQHLHVAYNEHNGQSLGISRADVAGALMAAGDGKPIGMVTDGDSRQIIYLQVRNDDGSRIANLNEVPVWSMMNLHLGDIDYKTLVTSGGREEFNERMFRSVPLSVVADSIDLKYQEDVIRRRNGKRAIEVECDPNPYNGASIKSAQTSIQDAIENMALPDGYSMIWRGEESNTREAIPPILVNSIVGVVAMLIILLLLFRSWRTIIIMLCCIPFIFCGIVPGLKLTGSPFTFMAIIGMLGLMGMMIKNVVVLMDEIELRMKQGGNPVQAIIEASVSRTRPVMMASVTTIVGVMPLLSDPMYASMAITIMCGLLVGTIATLVLFPLFYALAYGISNDGFKKSNIVYVVLPVALLLAPAGLNAQSDTLTLNFDSCLQRAIDNSYAIKKSANTERVAELQRKEVLTKFFPSISASASVGYIKQQDIVTGDLMNVDLSFDGMYLAGFQLVQPVFAGGQIVNGYRLSKEAQNARHLQHQLSKATVKQDLVQRYWTYVATRSKVKLLNEYLAQIDTAKAYVEGAVAAGLTLENDLMRLETSRLNILYQLERAKAGQELCRMSLSEMMNIPYDSIYLMPGDVEINIRRNESMGGSVDNRLEVRLLMSNLRIAQLQKKIKVGEFLPQLGLVGMYCWFGNVNMGIDATNLFMMLPNIIPPEVLAGIPGMAGMNPKTTHEIKGDAPLVMLSLKVPLTDWIGGGMAIKRSQLEVENAKLDLEENKKLMTLELRQAEMKMTSSWKLLESSEKALQSATEQLRIMRDRYEVGMCTLLELLASQSDWHKAESDHIEAQTLYKINEADYLRCRGE